MTDSRRKRNLQKEMVYNVYWDFFILLFFSLVVSACNSHIDDSVGNRNIIMLGLVFAVVSGALMVAFEKYKPGIHTLWEKNVINVLSVFISWFVMSMLNLVFFTSYELFVLHSGISAGCLVLLVIGNAMINAYFENTKRFRKPSLLIIDTEGKNFSRMKRIKYGVSDFYDSWYEHIEKKTMKTISKIS